MQCSEKNSTFAPMKKNKNYQPTRLLLTVLLFLLHGILLHAQKPGDCQGDTATAKLRPSFGLEYNTELQTDFSSAKWANLLQLHAQLPLTEKLSFNVSSVSIASTREGSLADDLQCYSNIEDANLTLAISVACMEWRMDSCNTLYAGIRRIDEDYFCSDGMSLFTNSSCGLFPTISLNHDVATFPNAALGVHYAYDSDRLAVNASLYNGRGHNRFSGHDNIFRFCPGSDGLFALAQMEYRHRGSSYFIGGSLHYGDDFDCQKRTLSPSVWAYAEQAVGERLTLLAAYSHAFGCITSSQDTPETLCRNFAGIGGIYAFGNCRLGIFSDYAKAYCIHEFATELTCDIPLSSIISLQPTMHLITTDGATKCIGMMRMNICI